MTVFVCLDGADGMLFHHRRQSRDAALLRDMGASICGRLLIAPGSEALLSAAGLDYSVAAAPLAAAGENDACFIEAPPLAPFRERITTLIIYRWNRAYPADTFLDLDYRQTFRLVETVDFPGTSHDKITKEVYLR